MRALVGFALALGFAVPAVLSASPALAAGCTASVSDPHPAQNETVTVSFVGPTSASATVVAHYHAVDNSATTTTDANGHSSVGFDIGGAPYNETVVVNVVIGTASCSTSFDPQAPSPTSSTTTTPPTTTAPSTTTPTTAVLTGVNSGSTTTTTAAPVAASTTGSSLPFTGNATAIEAGGASVLVGTGIFFLSSACRRKDLVRLLWPDER